MPEVNASTPNEDPSSSQVQSPFVYEDSLLGQPTVDAQPKNGTITPATSQPETFPRPYVSKTSRRADLGSYATKKLLGRNSPRFGWTGRDFSRPETSERPKQPLPERHQHELALNYLSRCIAFTPQEKEAIEGAIEEVRTELTMLHFDDPKTVHNINMHAQDAAWSFIGEVGQPSPNCLAEAGGVITTAYRPVLNIYDAFTSKMRPHAQRVRGLISDNQKELSLIINEAVENSNTYQMLYGFGAATKTRVERPLTHTERAIRESIIAREVIRDFGLQPYQLGKPTEHGQAFVAYKNRLFTLGNETVPTYKNAETTSDESFEALREWTLGKVKAYNSLGVNTGTVTTLSEGAYVVPEFTNYIAEQLDGTPCNGILAQMLNTVIARAFSKYNSFTYQEVLQYALGKAQRLDTSFIRNGYAHSVGLSSLNNSLLMWIRQTDCSNLQRHYVGEQFFSSFGNTAKEDGMYSQEVAAEAESQQIGSVLYDARTPQERELPRIIFEQVAEQPATHTIRQQRVLSLAWGSDETPKQVHEHAIYIPGFTVIAARQQGDQVVFDFARDPNGDPYTPTNNQLTHNQQLLIQRHYHSLGITTIANQLAEKAPRTVYETAQIIRQNSVYFFPQKSTSHSFTIKDAQMFTQCKGGAEAGQQALTSAQIASRVIKGLVLPEAGTAITLAGHSQVVAVQNGTRQIFDFTPEIAAKYQIQATPQPKNTPRVPKPLSELIKPETYQRAPIEHNPQQEALRQYDHTRTTFVRTRQAFEQTLRAQLKLHVNTPAEDIYERFVASTTATDIWWQTASTLFMAHDTLQQAAAAAVDPNMLQPIIAELQNIAANAQKISELPKEQRAQFASTYDNASLTTLSNTATQANAQLTKIAQSIAILRQD